MQIDQALSTEAATEAWYASSSTAWPTAPLRALYERFGFSLHSVIQKGERSFARHALPVKPLGE